MEPKDPVEPAPEAPLTLQARLGWFALCVAIMGLYFTTNKISAGMEARQLYTVVDDWIPFAPIWQHVYVSLLLFMIVPHLTVRHRGYLMRYIPVFCGVQVVAALLFLTLPVRMDRPPAPDDGSFTSWVININYFMDEPSNCFPSLHVANALFCSLVVLRVDKLVGGVSLFFAILLSISTMCVKQHFFLDVVAGTALGVGAWWLFLRPFDLSGRSESELRLPRSLPAALACVHLLAMGVAFLLHLNGIKPWE